MGKSKKNSARHGKKSWRKISSEDVDDFNEKATKDALSGGPLHSLPSDSLFFLDKSSDADVKRKIEKNRDKVLRYESVLQKNPFVQVVPSSTLKKKKKKSDKQLKEAQMAIDASVDCPNPSEAGGKQAPGMVDIWSDEACETVKGKKKVKTSVIPAVEVEPPGCSFNPEPEFHKDVLARAVADEMRKVYQSELAPQPIPLVSAVEAINEEERYFMEADTGSEDNDDEDMPTGDDDNTDEKRSSKTKRVTRVEFNRRTRRKEHLKSEAEAKMKQHLSKEIDCIPEIMQEIVEEEEENKKRHVRRVVAKQERLKSRPPRIGKRKFEPAPVQVLLSEEISGSLRKLQGCCTVARDRYKSLEKRGLVAPSVKKNRRVSFSTLLVRLSLENHGTLTCVAYILCVCGCRM